MKQQLPTPTVDQIRSALARCAPSLADQPITFLNEGWGNWVFAGADFVVRLPQWNEETCELSLDAELRLLGELAPALPLPVPRPIAFLADGPDGRPMAVATRVPGIPVGDLQRPPAANFGEQMGRFIRALHSFPNERGRALGLRQYNAASVRGARIQTYERLVRLAYPLLSCETRTYTDEVLLRHINDASEYEFEACLVHGDLDHRNVLADPVTGEITGVVDFGDASIHHPGNDVSWAYCGGFEGMGIEDQIPALLREGGIKEDMLRGRREWVSVWWPLDDVAHWVEVNDSVMIEESLRKLNAIVPRDVRC